MFSHEKQTLEEVQRNAMKINSLIRIQNTY